MNITDYSSQAKISQQTAFRDLNDLVRKGVLEKQGVTGKGTYYSLCKGLIKVTYDSAPHRNFRRTKGPVIGGIKFPTSVGTFSPVLINLSIKYSNPLSAVRFVEYSKHRASFDLSSDNFHPLYSS